VGAAASQGLFAGQMPQTGAKQEKKEEDIAKPTVDESAGGADQLYH
jgi:hypothetical protein